MDVKYGEPLPIVYGKPRVVGTLLWYGDFRVIEHKHCVMGIGSGGGDTPPSYTYCAELVWKPAK